MSANCLLLRRKHALAYRRRAVFHPMLSPHFDLDFLFSLSLISLSLPFLHFAFLILSFIPFSFYLVFLLSCFFSSFAVFRPFSQSAVHFLSIFVFFSSYSAVLFLSFLLFFSLILPFFSCSFYILHLYSLLRSVNSGNSLDAYEPCTLSMFVLDELPVLVQNSASGCLIPDRAFSGTSTFSKEKKLR